MPQMSPMNWVLLLLIFFFLYLLLTIYIYYFITNLENSEEMSEDLNMILFKWC